MAGPQHAAGLGGMPLTAQRRFADAEGGGAAGAAPTGQHRAHSPAPPTNTVTFPFVFPKRGAYRIVVQVKPGAAAETAAFDVEVGDAPAS